MSVDAIAARREARRRKILENSERRLVQIAGREESNVVNANLGLFWLYRLCLSKSFEPLLSEYYESSWIIINAVTVVWLVTYYAKAVFHKQYVNEI